MRPIVQNFQPKATQTFTLFTNGLLIKKQLSEGMPIFNNITNFKISVDAGSKEVYEDVRRPGKWSVLLENFDYLANLKKHRSVELSFALQNKNYKDIPAFIELCQRYDFQGRIHQLDDWGTWAQINAENNDAWTIANGIFSDHNVMNPAHPNHDHCQTIISQNYNASNIGFSPAILKLINK
jgi:molybdenum cofactor biosynthesis enzyme MoaA